ncbi:uncharacterized protein RCC_08987 [Ramularia collo-cygni]|uniref:Chromo domain-containing protein n=1 Tax=Ramularia collo-cygni TaxID=112498 RepID=A0A2D3V1K4_9PEZI|nr:uncharacterized protein RCC_08987 [Ramularia collo-cygni]CZT23276.1 uncharacterized protein RCC_08987 [Ramularia collo-cygni]
MPDLIAEISDVIEANLPGPETRLLLFRGWLILVAVAWSSSYIQRQYQSGNLSRKKIGRRVGSFSSTAWSRFCSISLGTWAIPFPLPVIWWKRGCCSGDLAIGTLLTFMGYIPGIIYAWHIINTTGDKRKAPREMEHMNMHTVDEIKAVNKDEDGRPMYLVSWVGYGSDQDTWEYAGEIDRDALRRYRALNVKRQRSRSRSRSDRRRRSSTTSGTY